MNKFLNEYGSKAFYLDIFTVIFLLKYTPYIENNNYN